MASAKLDMFKLKFKDANICCPETYDCYTSVSIDSADCMVPCTGLYVDVAFTPDNILIRKQPDWGQTLMITFRDQREGFNLKSRPPPPSKDLVVQKKFQC